MDSPHYPGTTPFIEAAARELGLDVSRIVPRVLASPPLKHLSSLVGQAAGNPPEYRAGNVAAARAFRDELAVALRAADLILEAAQSFPGVALPEPEQDEAEDEAEDEVKPDPPDGPEPPARKRTRRPPSPCESQGDIAP